MMRVCDVPPAACVFVQCAETGCARLARRAPPPRATPPPSVRKTVWCPSVAAPLHGLWYGCLPLHPALLWYAEAETVAHALIELDSLPVHTAAVLPQVCGGHGHCLGITTGYCECNAGYTGSTCSQCATGYVARSGTCLFLPGALATCSDGVRNGQEEGVDCGGDCAATCPTSATTVLGQAPVSGVV
jgi:hypothetical protein